MKVEGRKGPRRRRVVVGGEARPGPVAAAGITNDRADDPRTADVTALRLALGDVGAVRQDRVAALRAALARGQYRVDAAAVAEAVVRETVANLLA